MLELRYFMPVLCIALIACSGDDDDMSSSGDAGARTDAGADAGGIHASLPSGALMTGLCGGAGAAASVALSPDADRIAFLSCASDPPRLLADTLPSSGAVTIARVSADTRFEFTIDGEHLVYVHGGSLFVRRADAAEPEVEVPDVEEYRLFLERVSNTAFAPRLLTLERGAGDTRAVRVRAVDDGYAEALDVLDDAPIRGGLDLLSASGRTLIVRVEQSSDVDAYLLLRTDASADPLELPFDSSDFRMAPVGLGDTHNFALDGDRVVRIELETGATEEVVPAGAGLLADTAHLLEREDRPGVKHLHFIADGDPSRRIRDGSEPAEVLATANATAQVLSPDLERVVFLSDGDIASVPAVGGEPEVVLLQATGLTDRLEPAFAPDGSELAILDADGTLWRAPIAEAERGQELDDDGVEADTIGYTATGSHVVWIAAGELKAAEKGDGEPTSVAADVDAWWPIADSDEVLYLSDGTLLRAEL